MILLLSVHNAKQKHTTTSVKIHPLHCTIIKHQLLRHQIAEYYLHREEQKFKGGFMIKLSNTSFLALKKSSLHTSLIVVYQIQLCIIKKFEVNWEK